MASFGETLRRERELRGVSLREIADATKISVRFLQALEQDRLDVLPGGVFRRAFVKQYAQHLGLDAERLAAEFVYAHGDASGDGPAIRPRESRNLGTLFLVVVFGAGAVLSLWRATPSRDERSALMSLPAARRSPAPMQAPVSATALARNPESAGFVVTLQAQKRCWVEARVDGQTVLNREIPEGQQEKLEAQGEIVLSVGDAGALSVTVNDRPGIPLGKAGEVRRNIVFTKQSLPSFVEDSPQLRASHSS
jgi:cytoskeletal protein RodZ